MRSAKIVRDVADSVLISLLIAIRVLIMTLTAAPTQAALLASDIDAATRYATEFASYADMVVALRSGSHEPHIAFWADATPELRAARRHLANRLASDGLAAWFQTKPVRSATFRYVRNLARVARGDLRGTYSAARDLLDEPLYGADRGRVERLIRACETHLARR